MLGRPLRRLRQRRRRRLRPQHDGGGEPARRRPAARYAGAVLVVRAPCEPPPLAPASRHASSVHDDGRRLPRRSGGRARGGRAGRRSVLPRRDHRRLERHRRGAAGRRGRPPRPRAGRARLRRRRAARTAPPDRPPRARGRLPRLLGAQGLRAVRHRRARLAGGRARQRIAAPARWRRRPDRHARGRRLGRDAETVRGRHAQPARCRRPRRGLQRAHVLRDGCRRRAGAAPRDRALGRARRDRRRARSSTSGRMRPIESASPRSRPKAGRRTSSGRIWPTAGSPCAPDRSAPIRFVAHLLGVEDAQTARLLHEAECGEDVTIPGAVRASVGLGTTRADIDAFLAAIAEAEALARPPDELLSISRAAVRRHRAIVQRQRREWQWSSWHWSTATPQRGSGSRRPQQAVAYQAYVAVSEDATGGGSARRRERLEPTAAATSVRVRNGDALVTDGPYAEVKESLGGYYLFSCARSMTPSAGLRRSRPPGHGGAIEIRPVHVDEEAAA